MDNFPRGIRNNNPGNIDISKSFQYQGEVIPSRDPRFCTFEDMPSGIRAMALCFLSYSRHGIKTIGDYVSRWAPSTENNTAAYIYSVVTHLNATLKPLIPYSARSSIYTKLPNDPLFFDAFISSFIIHEEGMKAFVTFIKPSDIALGVDMALHIHERNGAPIH